MVILKATYELTLTDFKAESGIEAWLQAGTSSKLKEYFMEYLAEKLKDGDYEGISLSHVGAEWRPDNDES